MTRKGSLNTKSDNNSNIGSAETLATATTPTAASITTTTTTTTTTTNNNISSSSSSSNTVTPSSSVHPFSLQSVVRSFTMFLRPELRMLLFFALLVHLALSSFYMAFPIASQAIFGMDEEALGAFMSAIGGLSMLINVFVIPPISLRYKQPRVMLGALVLLALSLGSLGFVRGVAGLYMILPVFVLAMALFRAYSVSIISSAVPASEAGTAISLAHATASLGGVLAPALTGHLYNRSGFAHVCLVQAVIVVIAGVVLVKNTSSVYPSSSQKHK